MSRNSLFPLTTQFCSWYSGGVGGSLAQQTGLSINSSPWIPTLHASSNREQIPLYSSNGAWLGSRSINAATRLIAGGLAKPSHGRKRRLKAIWLGREDGGNPVETHTRTGLYFTAVPSPARLEAPPRITATGAAHGRAAGSSRLMPGLVRLDSRRWRVPRWRRGWAH